MKNAEDLRQVSQDNVPTGRVENEVNRIENVLFAEAQKGERSAKVVTPYVLSEAVFAALEEAGYAVKIKSKSIIKGVLMEITW